MVANLRDLARQLEEIGRAHPCWSQVHQSVSALSEYLCARARLEEIHRAEIDNQVLEFQYTNWRGETETRTARISGIRWGTSDWYREPQWLVRMWDLEKSDFREFTLSKMQCVRVIRWAEPAA